MERTNNTASSSARRSRRFYRSIGVNAERADRVAAGQIAEPSAAHWPVLESARSQER
ncbi:hypothetical protein GS901_06175 [Rhodococcus hoagii]|nr:hypothetical protein [Prescottella equi]